MDRSIKSKAFPPDQHAIAMVDPNDPTRHVGGTPWLQYKNDADLREALKGGHAGFEFNYIWSK